MNGFSNQDTSPEDDSVIAPNSLPNSHVERQTDDTRRRKYVTSEEYCELVTSRRALVRHDVSGGGVRGLCDDSAGVMYLIEARRLGIWR